jgi:hypothetical protein
MPSFAHRVPHPEFTMGKYLIAWLLGVPATVLLLIYLIF